MNPTETDYPNAKTGVHSRWPRIVSVCAGIALLAGIVLLWSGSTPDRESSENSALASTMSDGSSGTSPQVPLPVGLPGVTSPSGVVASLGEGDGTAKSADGSSPANVSAAGETGTTQGKYKREILGSWKQYSYGQRLLKVLNDGTATIDVKLDGLTAFALGEKIHFDIEWEIEGDMLVFKTVGGTPESSVKTVEQLYGNKRVYRILEINEKQMLLQEDDEKKTSWDRVKEEESPAGDPPQAGKSGG